MKKFATALVGMLAGGLVQVTVTAPAPRPLAVLGVPGASASAVLEACFERSLRLRCFDVQDPDLHEVFVHLVGPSAREAALR